MSREDLDDDINNFRREFREMIYKLRYLAERPHHVESLEDLRDAIKEYSDDMIKLLNLKIAFIKRSELLEEGKRLVDLKTFSKGEMLNNPGIILELDKS